MGKYEFGGDGDETRILSTFFTFEKSTRGGYITFGARKTFYHLR